MKNTFKNGPVFLAHPVYHLQCLLVTLRNWMLYF